MLPVACLPLCGIWTGIGYLLCPTSMQGGEITGLVPAVGMFLAAGGDPDELLAGPGGKAQSVADALRERMKLS